MVVRYDSRIKAEKALEIADNIIFKENPEEVAVGNVFNYGKYCAFMETNGNKYVVVVDYIHSVKKPIYLTLNTSKMKFNGKVV